MKTRVAIIGLGGVADRIHLPACRELADIELVGACDPNVESRRRLAEKFNLPRTFGTAAELLSQTRPEVVIVGTPPSSHFTLCEQALEAGANVLCEKPFMSTMDEADRIISLARSKNLLLRVNNQYRFMDIYRQTRERLQKGEFGRLFYIQAWQQMFHPPAHEKNWRNQLEQYVLFEFATHALDLMCFFFDDLPSGMNVATPRCRSEYSSDVLVNGTLRFSDERLATLSFNRVSHAPEKYLEMRLECERASVRISLGGVARWGIEWSKAAGRPVVKSAFVKGGEARMEVNGRSKTYSKSRNPQFATATAEHLKLFLAEMSQPRRNLTAAEHAREVLRLVFAGYESARTGETVWLDRLRTPDQPQVSRTAAR